MSNKQKWLIKRPYFLFTLVSLILCAPSLFAQKDLAEARKKAQEIAEQRAASGQRKIVRVGTMKHGDTAALKKAQDGIAKKYLIKELSDKEIAEKTTSDFFTQSEGHLQSDIVMQKMIKVAKSFKKAGGGGATTKGVKTKGDGGGNGSKALGGKVFIPYLHIIVEALQKEAELKDSHYAFYHASDNEWRLPQDLYTKLYSRIHPEKNVKDFIFLRFTNEDSTRHSAQSFIVDRITKHGLPDDTNEHNKPLLLSTNPSMFGNIGFSGECTWNYFKEQKSHKEPSKKIFKGILKDYRASDALINEITSLSHIYDTSDQTLIQIFVPKEKVDEIAYLAWVMGIPSYTPLIEAIKKQAGGRLDGETLFPIIRSIIDAYKPEKIIAPAYKQFLQSVLPMHDAILAEARQGKYKVSEFIKIMRNNPWSLKGLNDYSVRLLFTPKILLNPNSGVKMYRYTMTSRKKQLEYEKALDAIVTKIVGSR